MRKHLVGLSILLLMLAFALPAQAESWNETVEFDTSFAFTVNDTDLPAGTYILETSELTGPRHMRVRLMNATGNIMARTKKSSANFNTEALSATWKADAESPKAKLVFAEHDNGKVLAEVWLPDQEHGREVVSSLDLEDSERTEIWSMDESKDGYGED